MNLQDIKTAAKRMGFTGESCSIHKRYLIRFSSCLKAQCPECGEMESDSSYHKWLRYIGAQFHGRAKQTKHGILWLN